MQLTAVDLTDPLGHVVKEVTVVGDGQDGTWVRLEVALQPVDGLGVQVVGGLVEEQQVRLLDEELAQGDATTLTTGEHVDRGVAGRALQGIHRLLEAGVDVPGVGVVELGLQLAHLGHEGVEVGVRVGHLGRNLLEPCELRLDVADGLLDVLANRLVLGERGLLEQDPDCGSLGEVGVTVVRLVEPSHQLEHRRLTSAVRSDNTNLGAREERQRDIVENNLVTHRLSDVVHGVDELGHRHSSRICGNGAAGTSPTVAQYASRCNDPRHQLIPDGSPRTSGTDQFDVVDLVAVNHIV